MIRVESGQSETNQVLTITTNRKEKKGRGWISNIPFYFNCSLRPGNVTLQSGG